MVKKSHQEKFARRYLDLLKSLDDACKQGPWDRTLILTGIGKRIARFRDELSDILGVEGDFDYEAELKKLEQALEQEQDKIQGVTLDDGLTHIYIVVYSATPQDIKSWEKIATGLTATVISRPIYRAESHAQAFLESKGNRDNEGYIVIALPEEMILKPFSGQLPTDRLGHELLVLKRGAVVQDNLQRLVLNQANYTWRSGRWFEEKDDDALAK